MHIFTLFDTLFMFDKYCFLLYNYTMLKKYFIILIIFLSGIISLFSFGSSDDIIYFPIHQKSYYISSYYEYRTLGTYHFHNGIDIPLTPGTPLYPLASGVVSFVGYYGDYGNSIIITYHNGYKSLYGHISSNYIVSVGDKVSKDKIVAYVGPKYLSNGKLNGYTTGPHLHFTLYKNGRLINPLEAKYST